MIEIEVAGQARQIDLAGLAALDEAFQVEDVSTLDSRRSGRGVWFRGLVEALNLQTAAGHKVTLSSSHDDYRIELPLAAVCDEALLLYAGPDGSPLPTELGGPVRFMIPNPAACNTAELDACSNVKFVDGIQFSAAE